jgi:hypothetical protein
VGPVLAAEDRLQVCFLVPSVLRTKLIFMERNPWVGNDGKWRYLFSALRAADVPFAHSLLFGGLGAAINKNLPLIGAAVAPATSAQSAAHWYLFGAVAVAAGRQIFWNHALSVNEFPAALAVGVPIFNTLVNTLAILFSLRCMPAEGIDSPLVRAGFVLFALGSFVETFADIQRKLFKVRSCCPAHLSDCIALFFVFNYSRKL